MVPGEDLDLVIPKPAIPDPRVQENDRIPLSGFIPRQVSAANSSDALSRSGSVAHCVAKAPGSEVIGAPSGRSAWTFQW